jgi:hypothetical protein
MYRKDRSCASSRGKSCLMKERSCTALEGEARLMLRKKRDPVRIIPEGVAGLCTEREVLYISRGRSRLMYRKRDPVQFYGGFIKDEYCSLVQYKSGPRGRPSM